MQLVPLRLGDLVAVGGGAMGVGFPASLMAAEVGGCINLKSGVFHAALTLFFHTLRIPYKLNSVDP
jgi:hypothetical protein